MRALSRRSTKPFPSRALRSALTSSSERNLGACSGTIGGRIRAIGDWVISPSSRRNLKKACRQRYLLLAVPGLKRLRRSTRKGLDVLAPDAGHVRGHAVSLEELGELGHALEVGRDRAGGDVRGAEVPAEPGPGRAKSRALS